MRAGSGAMTVVRCSKLTQGREHRTPPKTLQFTGRNSLSEKRREATQEGFYSVLQADTSGPNTGRD